MTLRKHVQDQQDACTDLCGVLEALRVLDNDDLAPSAQTTLIGVALEMARKLNDNLDSVALPKE